MKNFSNALVVLVTTIPALDVPSGMIDYTFLLPGYKKNTLFRRIERRMGIHQIEMLKEHILPDLFNDLPNGHILRVRVAGCSTGEEAYSFAMVFKEATKK